MNWMQRGLAWVRTRLCFCVVLVECHDAMSIVTTRCAQTMVIVGLSKRRFAVCAAGASEDVAVRRFYDAHRVRFSS